MEVADLLRMKRITKLQYKSYVLFELNDVGREYLKEAFEGTLMEEPPSIDNESSFAWIDGRRSVWRTIKTAIQIVQEELDKVRGNIDE